MSSKCVFADFASNFLSHPKTEPVFFMFKINMVLSHG